MIAGNNSLIDIGDFAQSLNQNQLRSLRASRCRHTHKFLAPSEATLRRVLQRLDPVELDRLIVTVHSLEAQRSGKLIAVKRK